MSTKTLIVMLTVGAMNDKAYETKGRVISVGTTDGDETEWKKIKKADQPNFNALLTGATKADRLWFKEMTSAVDEEEEETDEDESDEEEGARDADDLAVLTASAALKDETACGEIAALLDVSERKVTKMLEAVHGKTKVAKVFAETWPSDESEEDEEDEDDDSEEEEEAEELEIPEWFVKGARIRINFPTKKVPENWQKATVTKFSKKNGTYSADLDGDEDETVDDAEMDFDYIKQVKLVSKTGKKAAKK